MIAIIGLESIGDDARYRASLGWRGSVSNFRRYEARPRAWVAQITGRDPRHEFARAFLPHRNDYAEASGTGSRGVYRWYEIAEGLIVEVNAPLSWTSADRYFARSHRGQLARMTRDEVIAWCEGDERVGA